MNVAEQPAAVAEGADGRVTVRAESLGDPATTHPLRSCHLGYVIADSVRLFPDRPALVGVGGARTYLELDSRADAVALALIGHGVRPADRVALLWGNDVRYHESLLGVMRAGAIAVPLNVRLGDDALAFILDDAAVRGIVAAPEAAERAAALAGGTRFVLLPDQISLEAGGFTPPPLPPDALCMQPYTSGSTGRPKGVLLTHAGQIWNIDSVRAALLVGERDRALIVVPLFHANAGVTSLVLLRAGGACVVMAGFDPDAALRELAEHRCTILGGVPAMFRALVAARTRALEFDVSCLRLAMVGSAPVPPDLPAAFLDAYGVPLIEGYGLTEGGPYVSITPPWGINRPGSAGLPVPGCELRVLDSAGEPAVPGDAGELWVKNPGVAVGYHNLPELTAGRLRRGWLSTGDIARLDVDGYVTIAGRADDMLNVGGENVYPKEVELVLLAHPAVREAVVLGIEHAQKGEVPAALVVREPGAQVDAEELKRFFLERGPAYAHPRRIVFAEELPLQGTGKPDREAIKTLIQAQT